MNFQGKYIFTMPTPRGELENTFLLTLDAAGKTFLVRKEAAV